MLFDPLPHKEAETAAELDGTDLSAVVPRRGRPERVKAKHEVAVVKLKTVYLKFEGAHRWLARLAC
jgi:hypothetical protein